MPNYTNAGSPTIEELLEGRTGRSRNGQTASAERRKEQQRRAMDYRRLALTALSRLHPDDYKRLHAEAKEMVDAKKGPLPN